MKRYRSTPRSIGCAIAAVLACAIAAGGAEVDPTSDFTVNGVKVIVRPRPSTETVAVGVFFAGGRANLTPATAGLERLLLDVATEGSEKFPRDVLRRETTRHGVTLSFGTNAMYSVISLGAPRRSFDRGLEMLVDAVLRPELAAETVERRRASLVSAVNSDLADADAVMTRFVEGHIYASHPYAPADRGEVESLRRIDPPALRAHHRHLLQGARMLVVATGNVDPADLRRKLRTALAGVPPGDSPEPAPQLEFTRATLQRRAFTGVPLVRGVFAAPTIDADDWAALEVAVATLNLRVFESLRTRQSLAYEAGASVDRGLAAYGTIRVQTEEPSRAARLVGVELERLGTEPLSERELKAAIAMLRTSRYIELQTNAAQAGELARAELTGGGWRAHRGAFESVTAEMVRAAASKWLRHLQWFVLAEPAVELNEADFGVEP